MLFTRANHLPRSQVLYDTKSGKKMAQQFKAVVILLTEIIFKLKLGTQRTSFNAISELKVMVPIEVIGAFDPVGKLTTSIDDGCALVKIVESEML